MLSSVEKEKLKERAAADLRTHDTADIFCRKMHDSLLKVSNAIDVLRVRYGCEAFFVVSRPVSSNAKMGHVSSFSVGLNARKFEKRFFDNKKREEFGDLVFPGKSSVEKGKLIY